MHLIELSRPSSPLPAAIAIAFFVLVVPAMALALSSSSLPKLVMLDRDGVINQDVGSPGVLRKEQFVLTPGAGTAIAALKRSGCRVSMITNQSCVGKGLLTMSELEDIHERMERLLTEQDARAVIDRIYVCTSVDGKDLRRKPNPGMIIEACRDIGVDPADAAFVGDTLSDLRAAQSGGVQRRVLVQTGYGFGLMGNEAACTPPQVQETDSSAASSQHLSGVKPFLYAANLEEAVSSIVRI